MGTRSNDGPEATFEICQQIIRPIYKALDTGISLAETWLMDLHEDPFLRATIVRYGAVQELKKLDLDDWSFRERANCGIEVSSRGTMVRVLRARNGVPPAPGRSAAKQAFYMQEYAWHQLQTSFDLDDNKASNLILGWYVKEDGKLAISLAKPRGNWHFGQKAMLVWYLPIPHAYLEEDQKFVPNVDPKFDDIPISLVYEDEISESGEKEA